MSDRSFLIIGLGPYAYMHHLPLLKSKDLNVAAVLDLETEIPRSSAILKQFNYVDAFLLGVPMEHAQFSWDLPLSLKEDLKSLLDDKSITDVIISTEARAHYAYLDFFSEFNLRCYVDKPLFAFSNRSESIEYFGRFQKLKKKILSNPSFELHIGLDKRSHAPFNFLREQIHYYSEEFGLVPQHIEISSCDGGWVFPSEFLKKDNHPFKYAYGKLLHSGIHYLDLLVSFLQSLNKEARGSLNFYDLYVSSLQPQDVSEFRGESFLKKIFPKSEISSFLEGSDFGTHEWGEVDVNSQFTFYMNNKKAILASVNLLSSGYSNRDQLKSEWNCYMKNGRVKHDAISIQIGPLANIRMIDFQSQKGIVGDEFVRDIPLSKILIFRNQNLTGLPRFEEIELSDSQRFPKKDQLEFFLDNEKPQVTLDDITPTMNLVQHYYSAIYSELVESDVPFLTRVPISF